MADSPTATVNRTAVICFSSRSYNTDRFRERRKRFIFFVSEAFLPYYNIMWNGNVQICKPVQWWGGGKMHLATARAAIWQFWEHHPWIAALSSLSLEPEPYSSSKHSLPCLPTPLIPLPSASPSLARSLDSPLRLFSFFWVLHKTTSLVWLGLMPCVADLRRLGVQIQPPPAELWYVFSI